MKKGTDIPPAVIVVVLLVVVAVIGLVVRKMIMGPQRVQMSEQAIKGMKEHMAGQGSGGAPTGAPGSGGGPGKGVTQHSN